MLYAIGFALWLLLAVPQLAVAGPVTYAGGDGSSVEQAIVILGADNPAEGVAAEYGWLSQNMPGAAVEVQGLISAGERQYDRLDVVLPGGERRVVIFDITAFFGKF